MDASPLIPGLITMVSAMISLFILVLVITYFVYFPVKEYSQKRKEYVVSEIKDAEQKSKEAHDKLDMANNKLYSSTEEASKIISDSQQNATLEKERILREAKEKSDKIISLAEEQAKINSEKIKKEMEGEVSKLVIEAAEKLIEKNLDTDANKKLIEEFIKSLEQ